MESIDLEIELSTVFENPQKSLIASEASYVYILSRQKLAVKQCYQVGQF